MSWRDALCGEIRTEDVGRTVTVAGWADTRRDHGGLVFVDLRDHTGILQLVVNPELAPEAAGTAHQVRNEFVLQARGEIVGRAEANVNPGLPTGEVELQVQELAILSRSEPLPFQLDDENVEESLRLRYRWLDLRREQMQRNLRISGTAISAMRRKMEELGFVDVWTPSLGKGTPEGARDFLVPVRLQPGKFFALAQSPQVYKQLSVIGGFDRYYQIATCWRDEDLRAERQFEFRQLDVEIAFAERDDVLDVLEQAVVAAFEAVGRTPPERPFPRMTWHDSMARYGSDRPDLRFGLEIQDATEITRVSGFGVFAGAERVRFLTVPQAFSRAELERLEQVAKEWGAKGLAYLVYDEEGEVRSPIAKFLSEQELAAFRAEPSSTVLFAADTEQTVARVLGGLRAHLGRELDLADTSRDELLESDPGAAVSQAYDLVWNGWELGSGSIRIHDREVQARVFRALALSDEEAHEKFGFLLEALRMGAPPHGGFAMGIERFVALLAGEPNIREIVPFPKVSSGTDPLTGAPTPMSDQVLAELGLQLRQENRSRDAS